MTVSHLLLLCLASLEQAPTPARVESNAPGRRVALPEDATLFVPEGYRSGPGGVVDVVLHLHGATTVVEPALVQSGWPAVLVTFNRKGLSSVYAGPFSDATLLNRLLESTRAALARLEVAPEPKLGRLVVSSFSAGFGGVRALLKVPEHFDRIDGLIMADSIYCGYVGDPTRHQADPALMDGFRRFAEQAAAGRKSFLLTHSAQVPEGYASTTETADYLLHALDATPQPASREWAPGWTQTRVATKGRFTVLGFAGAGPEDHLVHLRRITLLWKRHLEPRQPAR